MSPDMHGGSPATKRGRVNIGRWPIEHPYIVIEFYLGAALLAVLVIGSQMPRRTMRTVSMMPGLSAEEIRELEHVVERGVILARGGLQGLDDLPEPIAQAEPSARVVPIPRVCR